MKEGKQEVICPFCGKNLTKKPIRSWKYSPATVKVSRYLCSCGNKFNFYISKTKTWTIPKPKENNSESD